MTQTLTCPHCKKEISIDEALSHDLEEKYKKRYEAEAEEIRKKSLEWRDEERKKLEEQVGKKIKAEAEEENNRLKLQLEEARKQELLVRREKNVLEDERRAWELEKQRQLDKEKKALAEENALIVQERDKKIADMQKLIEELKLKGAQGSQQLQGEVLELEVEEVLRGEFPQDLIQPVGKGVRGADVLQTVRGRDGRACGTIVWESKRTKDWDEKWIVTLKENVVLAKGEVGILVSRVLPRGVNNFLFKDGIYVTTFESFLELARILREHLVQISFSRTAMEGRNQKESMVYDYITSRQFVQKVGSMMETYASMRSTLEREKVAMNKIWSQREKEIEKLQLNTAGIYGELQGLAGSELETVEILELGVAEEEIV